MKLYFIKHFVPEYYSFNVLFIIYHIYIYEHIQNMETYSKYENINYRNVVFPFSCYYMSGLIIVLEY